MIKNQVLNLTISVLAMLPCLLSVLGQIRLVHEVPGHMIAVLVLRDLDPAGWTAEKKQLFFILLFDIQCSSCKLLFNSQQYSFTEDFLNQFSNCLRQFFIT